MSPRIRKPNSGKELEFEPDAWERFRRAIRIAVKGGPQHRKTKPKRARKITLALVALFCAVGFSVSSGAAEMTSGAKNCLLNSLRQLGGVAGLKVIGSSVAEDTPGKENLLTLSLNVEMAAQPAIIQFKCIFAPNGELTGDFMQLRIR